MQQRLPLSKHIFYAFGIMGWSIMFNLISVLLIYFYIPPETSGLPLLISQAAIFGIFNVISLITSGSRFVDALIDPVIAQLSDRSRNPRGRRIPFMQRAILPSLFFCFFVFYPLKQEACTSNIVWLVIMLVGFYISSTAYIIPYNALLPELAPDSRAKVKLSTFQSVGYLFGIIIASNTFSMANWFQHSVGIETRLEALQCTIGVLSILAAVFMAVTAWSIDEKKYSVSKPNAVPVIQALRQTLTNRNFLFFIVADFAYFIAITLIMAGLMYFVTVLLQLPDDIGNELMTMMVLGSFVFYPIINILSHRIGKKPIVIVSLLLLAFVFAGVCFLGKLPLAPKTQLFLLVFIACVPVASLNILPVAMLAEVIAKDSRETATYKEGIYMAVRFFFVKIAQTLGAALFSMLLLYGKDVGNDGGIRLCGVLGFLLCLAAALTFTRFKEELHTDEPA